MPLNFRLFGGSLCPMLPLNRPVCIVATCKSALQPFPQMILPACMVLAHDTPHGRLARRQSEMNGSSTEPCCLRTCIARLPHNQQPVPRSCISKVLRDEQDGVQQALLLWYSCEANPASGMFRRPKQATGGGDGEAVWRFRSPSPLRGSYWSCTGKLNR